MEKLRKKYEDEEDENFTEFFPQAAEEVEAWLTDDLNDEQVDAVKSAFLADTPAEDRREQNYVKPPVSELYMRQFLHRTKLRSPTSPEWQDAFMNICLGGLNKNEKLAFCALMEYKKGTSFAKSALDME